MTEEVWRKIEGTNYSVSDSGLVRNDKTGYVTAGSVNNHGYAMVRLGKKGPNPPVHKLVVQAFPEICGELYEGCHIDHENGRKTDNRAVNLRVVSPKQNANNFNTLQKLCRPVLQFDKNGIYETFYWSYSDASKTYGKTSNYSVWKVLNHYKRNKSYKGKVFVYRDEGYEDFLRLMQKTNLTESLFACKEVRNITSNRIRLNEKMISNRRKKQN